MYCPILKGKQFELAALRELIGAVNSDNIRPLIEPINLSLGPVASTVAELFAAGIASWVVINPSQGEFISNPGLDISFLLNQQLSGVSNGVATYVPCIKIIDDGDAIARALLREAPGSFVAYVEGTISSALLVELMRASIVVLNGDKNDYSVWHSLPFVVIYRDGFDKKSRNLDYGVESFYSKLHLDYRGYANAIGFGDYTVLCERLIEGGGPAYVVTIHLSYLDPVRSTDMYVRHFSSFSDNASQSDPGGKFRESLTLLVSYVHANPTKFVNTVGLQEFFNFHQSGHYPGLGIVKKLSIKHHIQTLSTL